MSSATPAEARESVKERWSEGVANEIEFWRQVISGEGPNGHYRSDILNRIRPQAQIQAYLRPYLPKQGVPKILDVAAGPVSNVGWMDGDRPLDVTAVDALAAEFNAILDEFGLEPPQRTLASDGEQLETLFNAEEFDIVHIRNGLDHCYEPLKVLDQALRVTRRGGTVMIVGYLNEAEFESYIGLHQWNVDVQDGDVVIWRPGERYSLRALFADRATVTGAAFPDRRYMTGAIRKS